MKTLRPPLARTPGGAAAPRRPRPRFPVAAALADRLDDTAVVDVAVRLAAARGAPLLLIAIMPPLPPRTVPRPDGVAARAVWGRALPRLARAGIAYQPAVYHRPGERHGRLCEAKGLLDVTVTHGCSLLVVSRSGPEGLDACTVMQAAAIRGGPLVHAASPAPWAPLAAPRPPA
ncbi:universal stress protein [Streptomyces sp. NPDC001388]|uniref:universal stress protein n=1 Tax=Streptomyces sp. NPDC001388 TaxID=3364568 RepID=UPI003694A920